MLRRLLGRYRPVIALALVAVVGEAAYAVINFLALPVFVDRKLQATEYLGLIMGAFLLVEALMKGPMGVLSDRYGRRILLVGGPLVAAVSSFLITLINTPVGVGKLLLLVLFRALDGIAAAALWTTMFATMADQVEDDRRTSGMSALTVSYMIGIAIGPLLGGKAKGELHSYNAPFYLVSFLFVLTAIMAYFLVPRRRGHHHAEHPEHEGGLHWRELVGAMAVAPMMLLVAFVVFLAAGLLIPIAALYVLDTFGLDEEQFGLLFPKPAILIGLFSLVAGRLGDRWGHGRSVHLGMAVAALSMWAIVLLPKTEWLLILGATGLGLGFVIGIPAWLASISEIADQRWRGTIIGAVATAQGLGAFMGVLISPALYKLAVSPLPPHSLPVILSAVTLTVGFLLVLVAVGPGGVRPPAQPPGDGAGGARPIREAVVGERG